MSSSSSRKKPESEHEEHSGSERWLVSYADFITLMFAFFAVLYATSQKDLDKTKEFQESIKRYLLNPGSPGAGGSSAQSGSPAAKEASPIDQPIQTFTKNKPETVKVLDDAEAFIESQLTPEERKKYILDIEADDWGVRLTLPSANIYSAGGEKFREDAMPFLGKLGVLLAKSQRKVLVEGHVRSGEVGPFKSTWEFASARALNMLRYLEKKEGFPEKRLASASLGSSRPLSKDPQGPNNSRLELVLFDTDVDF